MNIEDDLKIEILNAIVEIQKKRYEEERDREKNIRAQMSVLITIVSIFSSAILAIVGFLVNSMFINTKIVLIFLPVASFFILISLVLAILSQWRIKYRGFPSFEKVAEEVNKKESTKETPLGLIANTFDRVNESLEKRNNRKALLLNWAYLFLTAGIILIITYTFVLIGVN